MLSKCKKTFLSLFLSIIMIFAVVPYRVFAAEDDVVSREKLVEVVTEEVDSLDFQSLGVDKFINTINDTVKEKVTQTVKQMLTPENIKILLKAAIKSEVRNSLNKYNLPEYIDIDKLVDRIVDSKVVDIILTDRLTQEVIDRTIEYAVNDIMEEIKIPTTEEVITELKKELIEKCVEEVYNSNDKETIYYNYKLQLNGFKLEKVLLGWNRTPIAAKVKLNAVSVISDNCKMGDLDSVDYDGIVRNAAKRAIKDVVKEEITSVNSKLKKYIDEKIDRVINEV